MEFAEVAAEAEHREGGAEPELAETVFRLAARARVVANAELADAKAGGDGDGGEEGLEELEREERGDDLAA